MATRLPSIGSRTARGADRARWHHARGVVPALLAMGLAALVSASAARNETLAASAGVPAPAAAARPAASPAADPSRHPGLAAEADIEAVAGTVARRYRISQEATRELVGEAYGAGRRIGLDPLLIIAVMAVESRFNPIAQSDGGAIGLMQVIPRYHADQLETGRGASVLDPRTNIGLGARVLKEYIRRGGTEAAGLQLYNGAAGDASNGYANKVLGERQRLQEALRRARERSRA
jgi:soluble lytic murein transglycosylase-like protein